MMVIPIIKHSQLQSLGKSQSPSLKKKKSSIFQPLHSAVISVHGKHKTLQFLNGDLLKCSLVLDLRWSLQLLFLWEHTAINPGLPLNLGGHTKKVFFILKILGFVLPGAQSVSMQENLTVLTSGAYSSPQVRNEAPQMLHCFTGMPHLQLCREILVPKSQYHVIMSTAFL